MGLSYSDSRIQLWAARLTLLFVFTLFMSGTEMCNRRDKLGVVQAQDLQFNCISCADKFDKCEIDCAWTLLVSAL
jgi:hypothetical protein